MPFKKGQSGNPKGRKAGTPNKITGKTREVFQLIVEANHEQILKDIAKLEPKDRVKVILDMAQYFLPKMNSATIEANVKNETKVDLYRQLEEMSRLSESRYSEDGAFHTNEQFRGKRFLEDGVHDPS